MAAGSIKSSALGAAPLYRAAVRRRVLTTVQAAKKSSSPWSSGGPKRGRGGGKGDSSGSNSSNSSSGAAGGKKTNSGGTGSGTIGSSPWKDTPSRQGLSSRPAKGGGSGASAGLSTSGTGGARLASRLAPTPAETTFTNPVNVTLLDELTPTEPAAEPKWGTFCSHLSGEWVGQYAAYTPWEGKPEPAWMDERGKYVTVVYSRALEQRVKYPPQWQDERQQEQQQQQQQLDEAKAEGQQGQGRGPAVQGGKRQQGAAAAELLVRKIGRCTRMAALSELRLRPPRDVGGGGGDGGGAPEAAQEQDAEGEEDEEVDVEALSYNYDGVVIFDGGNYSSGPEYIGQQPMKFVKNEDIVRSDGEEDEQEGGQGNGQEGAARARSGAAASTSAPGGRGGGRAAAAAAPAPQRRAPGSSRDEDEDEEGGELEGRDGRDGRALPPATTTSVFEQCLTDWGSRTRMRLKLTMRVGQLEGGEVDVQLLRMLLFREEWTGPVSPSPASERMAVLPMEVRALAQPCTELPRPTPAQLQGSWNIFTVCATGVNELDSTSGEERVAWVYSSNEEQQLWDTCTAPPSGDEGASFWLPGGIVLSLRMVDNYVPVDLDSDSGSESTQSNGVSSSRTVHATGVANGNGNGNGNGAEPGQGRAYPRGLCVSMAWLWREGSVSLVEREYDGYGYLREVRLAQGVKGGWSGGRM